MPFCLLFALLWTPLVHQSSSFAKEIEWERTKLSRQFRSEGAAAGDINGDGQIDLVAGPIVYFGPDFKTQTQIFPQEPFSIHGYSQNFLQWCLDIDGDGDIDTLVAGFPGEAVRWYANPAVAAPSAGSVDADVSWQMHIAMNVADGESPEFVDVTGDGRPEMVCVQGGAFGYAEIPTDPTQRWEFRAVSKPMGYQKYTHGLGVGDVNTDGRADIMSKDGWWEQPETLASGSTSNAAGEEAWEFHPFAFADRGGAQMFAADFDGDGVNEVVTSLNGHGYGLSMFDPIDSSCDRFTKIDIMTDQPNAASAGLATSQLHALALTDINADGRPDILTGKRFWAHQGNDPGAHEAVDLFWVEYKSLASNDDPNSKPNGRFEVHPIDSDTGVGTQITVADLNADQLVDIVSASKRGVHVLLQQPADSDGDASVRELARPAGNSIAIDDSLGGFRPSRDGQRPLNVDFETGTLADWTATGSAFFNQPIAGDVVSLRRNDMTSDHEGEYWIAGFDVMTDAGIGTLTSDPIVVTHPFATFLMAGGGKATTSVQIVSQNESGEENVLFEAVGTERENLRRATVDLSEHQGEVIRIRVIDEIGGHWGHVNFDDFRFHATEPNIPQELRLGKLDQLEFSSLAPQIAASKMSLPNGFSAQTIAAEPDVQQPIAMTIDHRGRIWIAEAYEYPRRAEGDIGRDRILVLEDTNQDGSLDSRKVFYEGLNLVSGLEVGHGGVWVGAAPYLMFIPDRDGDDVPDGEPEIKLDGWGFEDTHETLNAFIWGPDGWLYGCHGVFTHSNVGKPGCPPEDRQRLNAGIWRYDPIDERFEVFAHGTSNPWGVDFNEHGQCFLTACVIPHLYHVIEGGRYARQAGQHFDRFTFVDIPTIANHRHWVGGNPWAGIGVSDNVGGGHAHSGAMFYQGGSWPDEYRNHLIMNNIHGARLNQDLITPRGSGYEGNAAPDFLLSNDQSSQILYFRSGPDGQVYAIDWYDMQQCHTNTPGDHDRTNGRIYRISYGDAQPVSVNLASLSDQTLAKMQSDRNDWSVRTSRRLLTERSVARPIDANALAIMRQQFTSSGDDTVRLNGLWALACCRQLTPAEFEQGLLDKSPYVRGWTIQLLRQRDEQIGDHAMADRFLDQLRDLAIEDPSPIVRLYLASFAERSSAEYARPIVRALLEHGEDAGDHNLPKMDWFAASSLLRSEPDAFGDIASGKLKLPYQLAIRQMVQQDDGQHMGSVVRSISSDRRTEWVVAGLNEILIALASQREFTPPQDWDEIQSRLAAYGHSQIDLLTARLAAKFDNAAGTKLLVAIANNGDASIADRLAAISTLREVELVDGEAVAWELLGNAETRSAAIGLLSDHLTADSSNSLIGGLSEFTASDRRLAIYALLRRKTSVGMLLDAIETGRIPSSEISADMVTKIRAFGDQTFNQRLAKVWGTARDLDESVQKRMVTMIAMLNRSNTHSELQIRNGREVFRKTCQQCHKLFGEGEQIGPELTGSNRRDTKYLLSNILDPSAVMADEYQPTMIVTEDAQVFVGLIRGEDDSSIRLQTAVEALTVYKDEVEERQKSSQSMMPSGLLDNLSEQQVQDLVAYIQSTDGKLP
jgi:putative membrane-bound dehydrogenase-like protein